jgi:SAM-dependent methyltransferase
VDDFRAASLQGWSSVAPDWGQLTERVDEQLGPASDWMLTAVQLKPGERVLELAGGPGTVSLLASGAVGPEGHVIYSDFAAPMIDAGRRRLAQEGATNVEARVMDAEAIELPDGAVDVVLCRMGYMLMADPAAALRETRRVLAPGGRLALAVWSDAASNPWVALPMQAIMQHLDAPAPPPDAPGIFALADEQRLRGLIEQAGLEPGASEPLDAEVRYDSLENWFELTRRLAGPVRALLASADDAVQEEIKESWRERSAGYEQSDGSYLLPTRMLVASARRP